MRAFASSKRTNCSALARPPTGLKGRELDFYWYQEPLRDYDIHGYKMLADALDIPIAGVEVNEGSLYTTPEYITQRAIDIVRFKKGSRTRQAAPVTASRSTGTS